MPGSARIILIRLKSIGDVLFALPGAHRVRENSPQCRIAFLVSRDHALTIDFQGYGETALLTWLTRASERWGSVYRTGRRWAYTKWAAGNGTSV